MITILSTHSTPRPPSFARSCAKALLTGACLGFAFLLLVGCTPSGRSNVEMPENNGSGSDLMRPSPCACEPIDFNSRGYEWVS